MAEAATGGFGLGVSELFLKRVKIRGRKVGKELVGWTKAVNYPLKIANKAITAVYNLLAFATDEGIKEVFGAEAEFEKDITSHIDLDFWLKIHNAEKRMDLLQIKNGIKKEDNDKSEISIAPSGAFTVRLKLSGSVSNTTVVRGMQMLTWNNKEEKEMQNLTVEGTFEVNGNVFIEQRFYFKADKKPYQESKIAFTGLAGEYEYVITTDERDEKRKKENRKKIEQAPTQFVLMEPFQIVFNSTEMTKNPTDE